MAQTGVLDYQRYLNTLQTLNNLGQTFPSNQQTYNFSVVGGTTSSWTATISWQTLVLDKVSYSSKATGYIPNVDNSQVIGYVDGGTSTQYTTGVISIPANMYTGPILPGGDFNVPLTVVQLEWFDGVTTYAQQIGFIQNWEPGVEIGDPTEGFDYHPVYSLPSTLTLTGQAGLLYGDNLTLTATSDIPLDLTGLKCRFFKKTGDVLLGEGTFSGSSANFTITTVGNFAIGTHEVYAVSPPYKNFLTARSNDFTITVADGIPLIVTTSTFTPSKAYYYVGETVTYNLGVIPDPLFTATGVAIANTVTIKLVNVFSPFTETPVATTNFVNGQTSNPFTIQSYMVDLARADSRTTYSVTTSSYNTTTYTATLFVSNTETVVSSWESQFVGRYAGGSTSTTITVAGTATVTIQGNAFPITITQDVDNSYLDDPFNIRVTTPNVAYYNTITIYANKGATTLQLYSTNSNGTSTFVAPISLDFVNSGTWNIYATYPGDFGSSIVNVNLPSTSNTLSHFKRDGYYLEPTPTLNLYRTPTNDILQVAATTATTLTNIVTFYNTATILGTGTWVRNTGSNYAIVAGYNYTTSSGFARNFEVLKGPLRSTLGTITTANRALFLLNQIPANQTPYTSYIQNTPGGLSPSYPYAVEYRVTDGATFDNGYIQDLKSLGPMTPVGWAQPVRFPSTTDAQWAPWENYLISVATDPGKRLQGPFGANANMTELNSIQGGFAYPKFPNQYTLFKYYDGTNYNLSNVTGTNITEIADPIVFNTTWTVGPVNPPYTGREIYRWDAIGDSRGYNVVAITASTSTQRPLSLATTERLYFPGTGSTSTRYIDLVEFIGTATWQTQANSSANFLNAPTTSTISVWLYKFTPTIPQTNTQFKTNYPLLAAEELTGGYGLDASKAHENWLNYGKKTWVSTNTNSAAANDLAQFYNDWFAAFTNPLGSSVYVNKLGPVPNQSVTLYLPPNTISTTTGLHATWPGTRSLSREYGKYYPFDIYKDPRAPEANISIQVWNIDNSGNNFNLMSGDLIWAPGGGIGYSDDLFPANFGKASFLWETNPIRIITEVRPKDPNFNTAILTGKVELVAVVYGVYSVARGPSPNIVTRVFSTATLINSTASFLVKTEDLYFDSFINLGIRYTPDSTSTAITISTAPIPIQPQGRNFKVGPAFPDSVYSMSKYRIFYTPFVDNAISTITSITGTSIVSSLNPITASSQFYSTGNIIFDFPFLATGSGTGKIFVEMFYRSKTYTSNKSNLISTSDWKILPLQQNGVAAGVYGTNVYGYEQSNSQTEKLGERSYFFKWDPITNKRSTTEVYSTAEVVRNYYITPRPPANFIPWSTNIQFDAPYSNGFGSAYSFSYEIGFRVFSENASIPQYARLGVFSLPLFLPPIPVVM